MARLVRLLVLGAAVAAVALALPEIKRYMKINSM
jgi:hypothetical protein